MTSEMDYILDWAEKKGGLYFKSPILRTYKFGSQVFYRGSVELKNPKMEGEKIFGVGRATSPKRAVAGAYFEGIERYFSLFICSENLSNSTNGWAVHSSREEAINNSQNELMERHLLTYSYLSAGWKAFRLFAIDKIGEIETMRAITKYSCGGKVGCMSIFKSRTHSGYSFGQDCVTEDEAVDPSGWSHSFNEGLEPLLFYDRLSSLELLEEIKSSRKYLEKKQMDMILDFPSISNASFATSEDAQPINLETPRIVTNVYLLRDIFDLPKDFYAAQSFCAEFYPLYVPNEIDPEITSIFRTLNASYGLPDCRVNSLPVI